MPAQGRGANLKPSQVKAAPKSAPPKAGPNPFKGFPAPPQRPIEKAAAKQVPLPKAQARYQAINDQNAQKRNEPGGGHWKAKSQPTQSAY